MNDAKSLHLTAPPFEHHQSACHRCFCCRQGGESARRRSAQSIRFVRDPGMNGLRKHLRASPGDRHHDFGLATGRQSCVLAEKRRSSTMRWTAVHDDANVATRLRVVVQSWKRRMDSPSNRWFHCGRKRRDPSPRRFGSRACSPSGTSRLVVTSRGRATAVGLNLVPRMGARGKAFATSPVISASASS